MELLYISGAYTDKRGAWYIHKNIEKAKEVARNLMLEGYAVICPHTMSAFMDCEEMTWEKWLEMDFEILKRCDGIVLLDNWETSRGAIAEFKVAVENEKETYLYKDGELCYIQFPF